MLFLTQSQLKQNEMRMHITAVSLMAEVSRCHMQFWALPVNIAACQMLHLTGKVTLPISVL